MKPHNKIAWFSCGRTHIGMVRQVNQDAYANLPNKSLWVVADGMGGHKDGEFASTEIVNCLKQFEAEKTIGTSVKKIYQQLNRVNQTLFEHAGEHTIVGSTVAVLYAHQQNCVVMWSGDSRIYLMRHGGLKLLTHDHNHESKLMAEGLRSEEIKDHPYAQILTHAIGGEQEVYLDSQIQELRNKDVFLLCSDGLNKEVTDSEIEEILKQMPYQKAVNHLMDLALKRGGKDNITIVLVHALIN